MTGNRFPLRPGAWRFLLVACIPLLLASCSGEYPQTTFRPVTDFGEKINALFYNTTAWTLGILLIVEAALLYILFRYRSRPGAEQPKQIHGNAVVEVIWTVIPAIIVAIIAIPSVAAIFELQRPMDEGAFEVDVIGHQWWWEFRYPELEGVVTGNEMHVPVGRMIYLNLRSADVIHSYWIPRLGGKRDANPLPRPAEGEEQRQNHLQFIINEPGVYDGQCAEYCGDSHAIMRMRVVAHEPDDFRRWVQAYRTAQAVPADTLVARGQQLFARSTCVACHSISGTNAVGQIGPNLTFMGDRFSVGAGALETTVENIARWIIDPQSVKPGALMPGIRTPGGGLPPTGLSEQDAYAIAAYLHSLRSDAVVPQAPTVPADSAVEPPAGTGNAVTMAAPTSSTAGVVSAEHSHDAAH